MRPVPPAVRASMKYARYIRETAMQEWGRLTWIDREGIRLERKDTRKILARLIPLRDAERERFGVGAKRPGKE